MSDLRFTSLRRGQRSNGVPPMLRVQNLSVRVGIRHVLEKINLELYDGDAMLVSGPNGSGKSTLLNAIAGLEPAEVKSGTIMMEGREITDAAPHERAEAGLAYLRQRENVFPSLSVAENLRLTVGPSGHDQFKETYPEWAADLPLQKRASLLSGGQRQKLAWAMATLRQGRLLLADEPEAGLSERLQIPEDITCLVVSHSPETFLEDESP